MYLYSFHFDFFDVLATRKVSFVSPKGYHDPKYARLDQCSLNTSKIFEKRMTHMDSVVIARVIVVL